MLKPITDLEQGYAFIECLVSGVPIACPNAPDNQKLDFGHLKNNETDLLGCPNRHPSFYLSHQVFKQAFPICMCQNVKLYIFVLCVFIAMKS